MKIRSFAVAVIFVIFLLGQRIFACSCFPLPPIYQAYENAGAVFIGKVIGSNEPKDDDENYKGEDIIFDIEVVENFKGVKGNKVKLNRGTKSSSCYSGYAVGETYLFYAEAEGYNFLQNKTEKADGVVYQGSFCNRTSNLRTAQDQLFFLREMLKGKPEPQIYGSVARSDSDPISFKYRHNFLEGIKVVLQGDEGKIETKTDKNGLFQFNNVPAGEYVVKPTPAEEYMVYFPTEEKITVLPDKKVSSEGYISQSMPYDSFYQEFSLGWNNKIDGRVVDSEGKPLERYVAGFLPLAKADAEMTTDKEGSPDHHGDKGLFWFYGETPGKYVLAVDVYAPFKDTVKKRFFYPNAESVKDAKIFDITATDKIKDLEVKLPFTIRYIIGELFWSDNKFINDSGWIVIKKLETNDDKINTSFDWESAKDGKFTIQVLEGFEYWVHSDIDVEVNENGKEENLEIKSKPQKIKIGKEDYPLKVIFEKPKNLISKEK